MMSLPKKLLLFAIIPVLAFSSCKKEYSFGVDPIQVTPPNARKEKQKTTEQYISILYANLFQKALGAKELVEITHCIEAFGDKETIHEIIISNFMNLPDVIVPTNAEMRADIDSFLIESYKRFYVRDITETEKEYLRNFLEVNLSMTAEMMYMALALSDEYQYY